MGKGRHVAVGNRTSQGEGHAPQQEESTLKRLTLSPRTITVEFGNSGPSRRAPKNLLAQCSLSETAYDCILADVLNNSSAIRGASSKIKDKAADICFTSQFLPSREWPPDSRKRKDGDEARKKWWGQIRIDKDTECPSCAYRSRHWRNCSLFLLPRKIEDLYAVKSSAIALGIVSHLLW